MALNLKQLTSGMFSRVLLNSNFEKIENKVNDDLVHRQNGSAQMQQDLDMNSNQILNVADPVIDLDVATKRYVDNSHVDVQAQIAANLSAIQNIEASGTIRQTSEEFTATNGQTVFTLTTTTFAGEDTLAVYVNGVRQSHSAYTTSSTNVITFSEVLQEGDKVLFTVNESTSTTLTANQVSGLTVATIADLLNVSPSTSTVVNVLNYHSDVEGGGGVFYWDANRDCGEHNGGTIIASTAQFPPDWLVGNQQLWFAPMTGTGCWVRQYDGAVNVKWFGFQNQNSPFGKTGLRLIAGEKRDAHYGWGSIVEIPNSKKWVQIYRKATQHGTEDGAEIRAVDSYDFGASWVNDRLVQTDPTTDSRPDKIALLANGRIGFFCNRASAGSTNKFPLFIYSDDGGNTWTKNEIPTGSTTYTFASVGGIIDFPASQGGDDSTGFVTFGYIDAGGVDAFTTTDNGSTWSTVSNVNGADILSENVVIRVGTEDKWLVYVRDTVNVKVFATTNLLSWGTGVDAGIESLSTPPSALYDSSTDKVYYFATARTGKEVDGYTNNLLYVGEDSNTLWSNNGVFTESYKSLVTTPNWTTGYLFTFNSSIGVNGVFTAGENVSNGEPPSSVWLLGNFDVNGQDIGSFVDKYTRNLNDVSYLKMQAVDNATNTYPLAISNNAKTVNNYFGAYTTSYNMGGATHNIVWNNGDVKEAFASDIGSVEYEFNNSGSVEFDFNNSGVSRFNGNNLLYGAATTSKINNNDAVAHYRLNGSTHPSIRSVSLGTGSARKHAVFHHTAGADIANAGEVGSISTTTTATAYNTSSDETLKDFTGEYSGLSAIDVIKADPVRSFNWKVNGEAAIGWGAQTSYSVSKDLATKGGWFKDDEEVTEGTEGAVYIPWGVDQSKRTPYLWAALAELIKRVEELESKQNN
jgi:hypothetical protein